MGWFLDLELIKKMLADGIKCILDFTADAIAILGGGRSGEPRVDTLQCPTHIMQRFIWIKADKFIGLANIGINNANIVDAFGKLG